ncbi:MAG: DUF3592 domain-containing protein [Bryobacteraceae bacterium]
MRRTAFLLVGISVFFLLSGVLSMIWNYNQLQKWQPVAARVIAIDAVRFQKRGVPLFRGEVTIMYSVNDVIHRLAYSLPVGYTAEESVRAELSRFAPGTNMRVFYNPANPDDILTDLGTSPRFFLFPGIITGAGLLLGVYSLWALWKQGTCLCPGCAASVELWHKFCHACAYRLPKQRKLVRL